MKSQQCFILVSALATACVDSFSSQGAFVGRSSALHSSSSISSSAGHVTALRMDLERDTTLEFSADVARRSIDEILEANRKTKMTIDEAEAEHGMPWKTSIDPKSSFSEAGEDLLYMPFWEWQLSFMKENLTNLRVVKCTNEMNTDFSFNENSKKKARIVNICATSDEYRKIRMTYYDAGDGAQVFNSVWYPDPKYNLPVLGVDLLAFNRKKYLAIVDFQPLHSEEEEHASTFEHLLEPIKNKYDSLKGKMSSKFYDETQFFSQQMLFARFEDEKVVDQDLFPAFKQYVKTHLDLVRGTEADTENVSQVLDRQRAYDSYSAERDPATGLFAAMFGADWAHEFVYDFLFSLSETPKEVAPPVMPPFMGGGGGGPPPKQGATGKGQHAQKAKQPAFVGAGRR